MKLKKNTKIKFFSPTKELLNEKLIAQAIWECLKDNDPEGVIEVLEAHIRAKNISKLKIPRTTVYHAFSSKNPTLNTLAKLVNAVSYEEVCA